MPNTVSMQVIQGRPDRRRPGGFTGVNRGFQAFSCRSRIHIPKLTRWCAPLVASEPDPDHTLRLFPQGKRFVQHAFGGLYSEVPDGIADPVQRHSEVTLATQAPSLHTLKQRGEL